MSDRSTARIVRRVACSLLLGASVLAAQEGYTISNNVLHVATAAHWQGWDVAVGAASITEQGTISPRFFRKRVNAALDATQFDGEWEGRIDAGSNRQDARFLIDGDPTTTWGPDIEQPRETWWVQLQLGRAVVADSVTLVFAPEEIGDPLLQFEVFGWHRPPPAAQQEYFIVGTPIPQMWTLYRTDRPKKDREPIGFVPRTRKRASFGFVGDALDILRIEVADTEGLRLSETTAEGYASLSADARGAVDYFRRGTGGRQTLTTAAAYATLPEERRGDVRYYRRERPRLAEIEVWTLGDNLNLGLVERGATATLTTRRGETNLATTASDGDMTTGLTANLFIQDENVFYQDLGTRFWVEDIHFLVDGGGLEQFHLELSDGSLAPDGSVLWSQLGTQSDRVDFRAFHTEPRQVRFVRGTFRGSWQMSFLEVMLYGEGYVAEAVLTSKLIDLGERKGLVSIEWDGDTPEGTTLELSTRTGNTLEEVLVYHDSDGRVVSEDRYRRRLPDIKKGEIISTYEPGEGFSPWSSPYKRAGAEIRSPRNRRFLQLRAWMLADTTSRDGPPASLSAIRVQLADLYTDRLVSEVWPTRVTTVGEPEARSFFVKPFFSDADQAFDEMRVAATAAAQLELVEVRIDDEVLAAGDLETTTSISGDTLQLQLPRPVRSGDELVEVVLRSTIYGSTTAFEAAVRISGATNWQIAEVGDATDAVDSESTFVIAVADQAILTGFEVQPPVFTPNGDGINDALTIGFGVNRLLGSKVVTVAIHDLSGRQVRRFRETLLDARGAHEIEWDGTDAGGRRVSPGVYVVRVVVDAQSDLASRTQQMRTVSVAY